MNKEEIKFYSIGRGSLNLDGKFYYGLDYAITDFMRNLEQENKELKEQRQELRSWLEKQCQEYKETADERGTVLTSYVIDKLNELEGVNNESN